MTHEQFISKMVSSYRFEGESADVMRTKIQSYAEKDLDAIYDAFTDRYLPNKRSGVVWANVRYTAAEAGIYPVSDFDGVCWWKCECNAKYSIKYNKCPKCGSFKNKRTAIGECYPDEYIDFVYVEDKLEDYSLRLKDMFEKRINNC